MPDEDATLDDGQSVAWGLRDNEHEPRDVAGFLAVMRKAGGAQQYLEGVLNKPEAVKAFHDQLLQVLKGKSNKGVLCDSDTYVLFCFLRVPTSLNTYLR